MLLMAAQYLVVLGVLHVVFGLVRFRAPLREVMAEGFVARWGHSEERRVAFWFILVGPLLTLIGQFAVHAVSLQDMAMVTTTGCYLLGAMVVGVMAFPKTPLWSLLPPALIFIAAGLGWVH